MEKYAGDGGDETTNIPGEEQSSTSLARAGTCVASEGYTQRAPPRAKLTQALVSDYGSEMDTIVYEVGVQMPDRANVVVVESVAN
ncbi:hypothetical protein E4U55_005650 [Claviceps digitariae]|nr:hypothetical protein E4U55_005650 [Claviceps digitariae]